MESRLVAIRGAITVDADERELVTQAARELVETILERNEVDRDDIVSIIFTATPDLTSEFPAVGARQAGLATTPLMCAQEIPVPGSQPRCIRVLLHAYLPVTKTAGPVYLRDAVYLRPDLAGAEWGNRR